MSGFTRRCSTPRPKPVIWLVAVGDDAELHEVESPTPDEVVIKRVLNLAPDTPIVVAAY